MKYKIILYGLMAALVSGCSSAYKASQTPDDVYYSPGKSVGASRQIANEDRYEDYGAAQEDRYLRMKVRNPDRWSMIDDYSYWNDSRYVPSYSYSYYMNNWNSFNVWNNSYSFNSWNSPFYYGSGFSIGYNYYGGYYPTIGYGYSPYTNIYISKYPTRLSPNVSRPSLNGYSNRNYNNSNNNSYRQGLGNSIRRIFTPNENNTYSNRNIINNNTNNNTNNTYRAPERSYTPSSSGSSSSSGSVSRPSRH